MAAPWSPLWLVTEVFFLVLLLPISVRTVRIPPSPNPSSSPSPSPGQSPSPNLSPLPSQSPSLSPSPIPSVLFRSPSPSPGQSPSSSPSPIPSVLPPSPSSSPSPIPGQSPSPNLSPLPSQSPNQSSSPSPSPSPSPSVLPTIISDIVVRNAAVAADDGRCSIVGKDVLEENGNAVDAAVATALCLGVVGAASSGIGGGAFMVIRLANGTTTALDMRERAPHKTTPDMYNADPQAQVSGPLSIAIPGEVKGLYKAWHEYGSGNVNWSRLVQPAIEFARNGFTISEYLHDQMLIQNSCIFNDPGLKSVYTKGNQLLKAHDMCKNEKLADTLSSIAKNGPGVLYGGEIGSSLVQDLQQAGGILTIDDLKEYEVIVRQPLNASVFGPDSGLEVLTMPPPSSGGAGFIMMLNILQSYGIPDGVTSFLGRHRFIEALKHMFAMRMNLGDPDVNKHPETIQIVLNDMLDQRVGSYIRYLISDYQTYNDPQVYGDRWAPIPDDGTTHISIIDEQKNAVALTSSINFHFGSCFMSPSTGILLNNQMDDFSSPTEYNSSENIYHLPVAPANFIEANKTPLSSMTPTIVLKDGELHAVIGASGGPLIPITVTQVFLNYFGLKMRTLDSVISPRCYDTLFPNKVFYENITTVTQVHIEVPENLLDYLEGMGYVLEKWDGEGAICQFVVYQDLVTVNSTNNQVTNVTVLNAVSDPRKGGSPAGY